jgi:hypothetical protein
MACGSKAADTNEVFLTDDGFLSVNHAKKVGDAKKSRESLPVEEFSKGNWGIPTNGFQLSLRFEKTTYAAGEPIVAILLLRNVTNTILSYKVSSAVDQDGPISFVLSDATGTIKPIPVETVDVISSRDVTLAPSTQHKYMERLDKRFALKNGGQYTVYARFGAGCPICFEIKSSKVGLLRKNGP